MMKVTALVVRTKMIGGGTSYAVYLPCSAKGYRPIAGNCYATVIIHGGYKSYPENHYLRVDDFLRTPDIDDLPMLTEERWDAFKRLDKIGERLETRIAKRAFPELRPLAKLPSLWAPWTKESANRHVTVELPERVCK